MMNENILLDKYSIIQKFSSNNNCSTYLTLNSDDNENYIIKHLSVFSEYDKFFEIVKNEANLLSNLNHSKIPKLIDFKIIKDNHKTNIYIVQEYIKGKNLKEVIADRKYFTEKEVIEIFKKLINILDYLHSSSPPLIHQDIKPSNIILSDKNEIYLIDFGSVNEKSMMSNISNIGISTIIGTHGYMPIEQFEGKIKPASDIYSLGLTLIYLLSHKEPLEMDKDGLEIDFKNYVNISDNLFSILKKMIEPDWKKRYQSVKEIEMALNNIDSITPKDNLNYDDKEKIKPYLQDNEKILWFARPNGKKSILKLGLGIYIFAIPWTAFSVAWTVIASTAVMKSIFLIFFPLFGLPFIAVGFGMLSIPFIAYKEIINTIYSITDKRILIIVNKEHQKKNMFFNIRKFFGLGTVKELKSYNTEQIKKMRLDKKVYTDGYGNITFYLNESDGEQKKIELIGLPDVDNIEKLIRSIFYN